MADILCVYYSRTGKTRTTMEAVAKELEADLVEITDGVGRKGLGGFLLSGFDAVRKSTRYLEPFTTPKPVKDYDLVILGTPVWAGRCSSIIREFLKKYGKDCREVAYVITRQDEKNKQEQVYEQMDLYTVRPHLCAISLKGGDVGEPFWRAEFVKEVRRSLEKE